MFVLYVACYSITLFHISEGRTVQAITGRNVSFSWSFSVRNDAIDILHGTTPFLLVWPAKGYIRPYKKDKRLLITGKTTHYTFTVTIIIVDVTENDSGIYKVQRQFDSEEFDDSVLLQVFGSHCIINNCQNILITSVCNWVDWTNNIYCDPLKRCAYLSVSQLQVANTGRSTISGNTSFYQDKRTIPRITLARHNMSHAFIVLQCNSSRALAESIHWKLNGSTIEDRSKYFKSNTFLYIMNLTVNDKYNAYTCEEFGEQFESEPYKIIILPNHNPSTTNHYITTSITARSDATTLDYHSTKHFVYVVLGIGATLAVIVFICLLRKCRNCYPVEAASNSNSLALLNRVHGDENLEQESRSEYYWTIVSNTTGEMSTTLESNMEQRKTLSPICERKFPKDNQSELSVSVIDVTSAIAFEGYIEPIHSLSVEHVDYIHPVHTISEDNNLLHKHNTI